MAPTRRRLLQFGAAAAAAGAAGSAGARPAARLTRDISVPAAAAVLSLRDVVLAPAAPPALSLQAPRALKLHNLHTGEQLEAIYFDAGRYVPDALQAVNHLLRDFRTGDAYPMKPQLYDLLHTIGAKVETRQPFQIISGYRSPQTNAMLREASGGVAAHSLHMQGMATDIRLPGLALSDLHRAALSLNAGGVGYYPSSDFVHVDIGRVRSWG